MTNSNTQYSIRNTLYPISCAQYALTLLLVSLGISAFSQVEIVKSLDYNPHLYREHTNAIAKGARTTVSGNYLFIDDTLQLPFIDDFSKNHLRSFNTGDFIIIDTINRSIDLGSSVEQFVYRFDTSWQYTYDTNTGEIDSFPKQTIQLSLNNGGNPLDTTDVITGWPTYSIYFIDTATNQLDSFLVAHDSIITYSEFEVAKDVRPSLWTNNYVYINDDYVVYNDTVPNSKLSKGVATFDGLNQFGLPHNNGSTRVNGPADTLTSKPIDLQGFTAQDDIYLSFLYQPQGVGDWPNPIDSLILEFKDGPDDWRMVWNVPGLNGPVAQPRFRGVAIHLDNNFWLTSNFQFRFRNYATITGNNDHWHLDYVVLDAGRSPNDTLPGDLTTLDPPTNFLKNYTAMPWAHFAIDQNTRLEESEEYIDINYRNNFPFQQSNVPINFRIFDSASSSTLFGTIPSAEIQFFDPLAVYDAEFDPITFRFDVDSTSIFSYNPIREDSFVLTLENSINLGLAAGDLTNDNDTITRNIEFFNYFAYDDGTAEKAYGLSGPGLKKFAYKFTLNKPDTLRAIQFHWTHINNNFTFNEITITAWDTLGLGSSFEDSLYSQDRVRFQYFPNNGFYTHKLDTPIVVNGTFYVGWQQLFQQETEVGLDMNNNGFPNMFFYSSGTWKQSSILNGAPMIRIIVGEDVPLQNTSVPEIDRPQNNAVIVYPNPAGDFIFLQYNNDVHQEAEIQVYDISGKQMLALPYSNSKIDIAGLRNGVYIIRLIDKRENKFFTGRFVVVR